MVPTRATRGGGLAVGLLAFGLFLSTISNNFSGASIEYISEITSGAWPVLLPRHKLLAPVTGWAFLRLWQLLGWTGTAVYPLQVFNALAGAVCVGVIYEIVARLTGRRRVGLTIATGAAASAGIWICSTEAEFVMPALAVLLAVTCWLMTAPASTLRRPAAMIALGAGVGLAILTFLTNAVLVPMSLVVLLGLRDLPVRARLEQVLRFLLGVTLVIVPAYLLVAFFVHGARGTESLASLQLYGGWGTGVLYGRPDLGNAGHAAYAVLRTLATFPGLGLNDRTSLLLANAGLPMRIGFAAFEAVLLVVFVAPLVVALRGRRELLHRHRRPMAVLIVWVALQAGFAFYWVPTEMKFWVPVIAAWWILVGLLTAMNARRRPAATDPRARAVWRRPRPEWLVPALAVLLLVVNGAGLVLPHRALDRNRAHGLAVSIRDRTRPGDLIIVPDASDVYFQYFGERETLSVLRLMLGQRLTKAAALEQVDAEIARRHQAGARVYLVKVQPGTDTRWDAMEALDVTRSDFGRFRTVVAWRAYQEDVLEVRP
jgi:hypothetical protein